MSQDHYAYLALTEPELRAVLGFLPVDFEEQEPLGRAFRKLTDALKVVVKHNDEELGR